MRSSSFGADRVAEDGRVPVELADMGARVGVEQQLVRIEAMAGLRLVGPVDAKAVEGARADVGDVAVKNLVGELRQFEALDFAFAVRASKMQTSTCVACAEKTAKLAPLPSPVAPSGKGLPSLMRMNAPVGFAPQSEAPPRGLRQRGRMHKGSPIAERTPKPTRKRPETARLGTRRCASALFAYRGGTPDGSEFAQCFRGAEFVSGREKRGDRR